MKFYAQQQRHVVQFHVHAKGKTVLDELSFIVLVSTKFDGEIGPLRKFWDTTFPKKRRFLHIEVKFSDWAKFDGASYHCNRNLTEDGDIKPDYVGALERADPSHLQAEALLARARG
jgi:hypothetical protein